MSILSLCPKDYRVKEKGRMCGMFQIFSKTEGCEERSNQLTVRET
jgi:hypothetical protein